MKKLVIAYYLPQFHRVPENDIWWGAGFTEWTQLKNAHTLFLGHTIRMPSELGQYDLVETPEIIEKQYQLANQSGIDGFCLWDYWFGDGQQILHRPKELILSKDLDVRYCFSWANHSWFDKSRGRLLKQQHYLGAHDYEQYFYSLLPHFRSDNYIKFDSKLLFGIFKPNDIPDLPRFIDTWNSLAKKNSLPAFFFFGDNIKSNPPRELDAYANSLQFTKRISIAKQIIEHIIRFRGMSIFGPVRYDYEITNPESTRYNDSKYVPVVLSGWDSSIRHGRRGVVMTGFSPDVFENHLKSALSAKSGMVLLKSWNEWAEGNILEPDSIYGSEMLSAVRRIAAEYNV